MKILSQHESPDDCRRADRICQQIESHAEPLRRVELGRRFTIDGIRWKLYRADRNRIYRVNDGKHWYLKITRSGRAFPIEGEILGATAAFALNGPRFQRPRVIRASVPDSYVLISKIPGITLKNWLYRSVFGTLAGTHRIVTQFSSAGEWLGRIHQSSIRPEFEMSRPLYATLTSALERSSVRNDITNELQAAISASILQEHDRFSHGCFTLENILVTSDAITVIDYERSGSGAVYHDLSMFLGQLLFLSTSFPTFRGRLDIACRAFVTSYREHATIDMDVLSHALYLRLGQAYVEGFCCGQSRPTILGFPVSSKRLRRALDDLSAQGGASRALGVSA